MELWELIARESIRDLVARYNANGDSGRFDPLLELFAEDAVVELPPAVYRGREEIRSLFAGAVRPARPEPTLGASGASGGSHGSAGPGRAPERIWHHTATLQIDLQDASSARGRCYFSVLTIRGLDHWGRYVDEYCRRGERWLFASRKISVDGTVPGGWGDRSAKS